MTRFVIDAGTVLRLADYEQPTVAAQHRLPSPTLLSSETLAALRREVSEGELPAPVARERPKRIWRLPIRLLGDAVLRRRAWDLAEQLGWSDTFAAEYAALTQLQADALVTFHEELAAPVRGVVPTAPFEALR